MTGEVIAFARDFVNRPSARTADRKRKIADVYYRLFGHRLQKSCSTCYIEALFKILKLKSMAQYELKKGYVAQFQRPFGGVKAFTNRDLQQNPAKYDPIAAEYLKQYPERVIYFVRIPKIVVKEKPVIKEVIQKTEVAAVVEPVEEPTEEPDIVKEAFAAIKPKRKPTRKSKKND